MLARSPRPVRNARSCWASVRPSYSRSQSISLQSRISSSSGRASAARRPPCGRSVARSSATNTADSAQLFIVDFRRTLLGVVESDHLAGYAPSAAALTPQMAALFNAYRRGCPVRTSASSNCGRAHGGPGPEIYVVDRRLRPGGGAERRQSTGAAARISAARQRSRSARRGGAALRRRRERRCSTRCWPGCATSDAWA